jgi:hypothetical protein
MAGTRRRPIVRSTPQRVTRRAIDLFRYLRELEDGGVSHGDREFLTVSLDLHREFNRRPWDTFITDVHVDDAPPNETVPQKLESWETAVALRRQLEQAIAADGQSRSSRSPTVIIHVEDHH